ncbi:MAG: DUF2142 domain-containing protein, partial [Burkholderiales bacterium]|nr:DUF2142 domain-containing protein [Anaerolineae bacterium]
MVTTNLQLANERTAQMINRMQRFAWMPLVPILIVFVILSIIYAWATPPLEASDELWHVGMVNFIADNGALPVQDAANPDEVTAYEQEGSQPPLYYMLAAGITQLFDRSDFEAARQPNPHAIAGIPGAIGNKNLVLHPTPPNTALMVYALRAFSILLGCVTICAVYATAQLLASDRPIIPVIAAGLTAFNPMFLFITVSVNNDNLVTALNSLVVWQILFMLRDGLSTRRSVVIAVLVALASLSKLSGLVLMPVVGLAALIIGRKNWRGFVMFCALLAGLWLLLAGWWYLRNVMLYGELFGTRTMVAIAGARVEP